MPKGKFAIFLDQRDGYIWFGDFKTQFTKKFGPFKELQNGEFYPTMCLKGKNQNFNFILDKTDKRESTVTITKNRLFNLERDYNFLKHSFDNLIKAQNMTMEHITQ